MLSYNVKNLLESVSQVEFCHYVELYVKNLLEIPQVCH